MEKKLTLQKLNNNRPSTVMNNSATFLVWHFVIEPFSDVASDVLCALLADVGFDSFEQTGGGVEAYVSKEVELDAAIVDELLAAFPLPDTRITYVVDELEQCDWNEEWERTGFEPIVLPGLFSIHKPDQKVKQQPYNILINPRMAFGSGTHETTSQLVELLLKDDFTGLNCLDMGCGTGILGICMALRGAKRVVGIDIDMFSVENTRENCALNNVVNLETVHGDARAIEGTFDFMVANIHRNIIVNDLPVYVHHLAASGRLVVSGFFTEDVFSIQQEAESHGLILSHLQERNNWAVLMFTKNEISN